MQLVECLRRGCESRRERVVYFRPIRAWSSTGDITTCLKRNVENHVPLAYYDNNNAVLS